jgi:hypothetical protein
MLRYLVLISSLHGLFIISGSLPILIGWVESRLDDNMFTRTNLRDIGMTTLLDFTMIPFWFLLHVFGSPVTYYC